MTARDARLRQLARTRGLYLSTRRGGYMLISLKTMEVEAGGHPHGWSLTGVDVVDYLDSYADGAA